MMWSEHLIRVRRLRTKLWSNSLKGEGQYEYLGADDREMLRSYRCSMRRLEMDLFEIWISYKQICFYLFDTFQLLHGAV
jgi:hypothetical protein